MRPIDILKPLGLIVLSAFVASHAIAQSNIKPAEKYEPLGSEGFQFRCLFSNRLTEKERALLIARIEALSPSPTVDEVHEIRVILADTCLSGGHTWYYTDTCIRLNPRRECIDVLD